MNKTTKKHLLFLFSVILLIIFLTIFIYYLNHPVTKQTIPINLTVGDYTGVNLDTDMLHFGTLKPGSTAQRPVHLRAEYYDVAVSLYVQDIPFIYPEQETFILRKGEQTTIRLFAYVDYLAPKKDYEGKLLILMKKL